MEVSIIKEHLSELKEYFKKIQEHKGKANFRLHRSWLDRKDPSAILCDEISKNLGLTIGDIKYIVDKDYDNAKIFCAKCGKLMKNLWKDHSYCSIACARGSEDVISKTAKAAVDRNAKIKGKFANEKENVDIEMKSIKQNFKKISSYINSLLDAQSAPNMSKHLSKLHAGQDDAIFVQKILIEYGIKLKELKYIIDKNCEGIYFFCPVCGKRNSLVFKKFCSNSCSVTYSNKHREKKVKNSEDEKPSCTETHSCEVEENENIDKETEEKERARNIRKKKYETLSEYLEKEDIELLTSFKEFLTAEKLEFKCKTCENKFRVGFNILRAFRPEDLAKIKCSWCAGE